MFTVLSLLSGTIFGLGLAVSGLLDPRTVTGFLSFTDDWRPGMLVIFIAGVTVAHAGVRAARRLSRPFFARGFDLPKAGVIDGRLIVGASLFGIGYGISGICPGPAVAGLIYGQVETVVFLAAMIAGMAAVHGWLAGHKETPAKSRSGIR